MGYRSNGVAIIKRWRAVRAGKAAGRTAAAGAPRPPPRAPRPCLRGSLRARDGVAHWARSSKSRGRRALMFGALLAPDQAAERQVRPIDRSLCRQGGECLGCMPPPPAAAAAATAAAPSQSAPLLPPAAGHCLTEERSWQLLVGLHQMCFTCRFAAADCCIRALSVQEALNTPSCTPCFDHARANAASEPADPQTQQSDGLR